MSQQPTRTDKVGRIEGKNDEVLWGRVSFLIGEMRGHYDQLNLLDSPRRLRHLLLRLPREHALLKRIAILVSQINEPTGEESPDVSFYYLLGYFRERKHQARETE